MTSSDLKKSSSEDSLDVLFRIIQETDLPPKPTLRFGLGCSWIPHFINPLSIELTRPMVYGVDCDEVYPGIFIGNEGSAHNIEFLKAVGITHVFNTAEGRARWQVWTEADYYEGTNIQYLAISLTDLPHTRIIDFFEEGTKFIENALAENGKILVHCLMGRSRSSTFVLAYLIMKKNMSAAEALRTLRKRRDVRPNDGFLKQLLQQEEASRKNVCKM